MESAREDSIDAPDRLLKAFDLLVLAGDGLSSVTATMRLEYEEIEGLVAMVLLTHDKARFALSTLCVGEAPVGTIRPLRTFRPSDIEIFRAIQRMLDSKQTISVICARHGFSGRQRRRLVLLLADYHSRLGRALEGLVATAARGHGQGLRNSFERPPLIALSGAERMRLARNHLHVERLKGGKTPKLKKLMKQFGLTVDEALAVTGRGKDKEFTK